MCRCAYGKFRLIVRANRQKYILWASIEQLVKAYARCALRSATRDATYRDGSFYPKHKASHAVATRGCIVYERCFRYCSSHRAGDTRVSRQNNDNSDLVLTREITKRLRPVLRPVISTSSSLRREQLLRMSEVAKLRADLSDIGEETAVDPSVNWLCC